MHESATTTKYEIKIHELQIFQHIFSKNTSQIARVLTEIKLHELQIFQHIFSKKYKSNC